MYNKRSPSINHESNYLPEFPYKYKNQKYNLNYSLCELSLDEEENFGLDPFNPDSSCNKNDDDVFNNTDEVLYYNQKKPSIMDELIHLMATKSDSKSVLINKKSIRNWNQINKIKRNLIQDNFLNWINSSIDKEELKLKKIEPLLLKNKYRNFYDTLDITLSDIYSNDLCKKEINRGINKDHNKNVIRYMENNMAFNIKINLLFRDALKLFYNEPIENKIFDNNLKKGLIDFKQYFLSLKKVSKPTYIRKLSANLDKISKMINNNIKQSEKTTGPSSEHQ